MTISTTHTMTSRMTTTTTSLYTWPHVNTNVHKECIINHTLMTTHSTTTPSTSHGDLTAIITPTIQMQQAHGLTAQETHMQTTWMLDQHTTRPVRRVNPALIPLCNTLLPHLPKQPTNRGKHAMRGHYDMIRPPKLPLGSGTDGNTPYWHPTSST